MGDVKDRALNPEHFAQVWDRVTRTGEGQSAIRPAVPVPARPWACLGEESACHESYLRQRIREELTDWRSCGLLAMQSNGWQTLRAISWEDLRQARRLSTACFLITGEQYFPREESVPLKWGRWEEGMRLLFHRKQSASSAYLQAANETRDPCLREQFQALSEEESLHALRIRMVLEQRG